MVRMYFSDADNKDIRGLFYPDIRVLYINLAAHRNGIVVLITEEPLIA